MWGNDTGARIPVHTKSQFARNQLAGKIGHHQQEEQQHPQRHYEQQIPSASPSSSVHHQNHHQDNQKKKIYINSGEETPPDYRQGTLSNMGIGGFLNSDVVPIHSTKRSRPNPNGVPHHHHQNQNQQKQQQQQPYFHPPSAEQEAKNREMMLLKNNNNINNDDDNVSPLPRLKGNNDNDNKDQNDDDEDQDPLLHIQQSPSHPLISPNRIRARNEYMNSEGVMSAILDNHQPINNKKNNHQQTKTSMTPMPKQMNTETLLQQQQQKRSTSATPDTNKIHQQTGFQNNIHNNHHTRRHLQLDDELSHLNHIPSIVRQQQNAPSRREPQPQPHQMLLPFQLNSNNPKPSSSFVSSPQQHQKKVGGAARYYQNLTSSDNTNMSSDLYSERNQNNMFSSSSSSPSKFVSRFPISRTSGLTNFLGSSGSSSSPFPRNGNMNNNNNNNDGDLTTLVWNNHNEAAHSHLDFNPSKPFEMGGPLANLALASNYYDHDSGNTNKADVEQEEKMASVAGLNESSQNSPGQTNL